MPSRSDHIVSPISIPSHTASFRSQGSSHTSRRSSEERKPISASVPQTLNSSPLRLQPSFWIARSALLALSLVFVVLASTLLTLWRIDDEQNGFNTSLDSSTQYAWTYGPTAVIIVIASLWRQVDLHCRATQPWVELANGPKDASRTVLLDYLSPLNVVSLCQALRFKHFHVVCSITGFLTLKMVVLFSTGLLVLAPTTLETAELVTLTTNLSIPDSLLRTIKGAYSGDPGAVHKFVGVVDAEYPEPDGMDGISIYQTAVLATDKAVSHTSVTVDVLRPNISCEIATGRVIYYESHGYPNIQLTSASCSVGGPNQSNITIGSFTCSPNCGTSSLQYYFRQVDCTGQTDTNGSTSTDGKAYNNDQRYAFWLSNVTFETTAYKNSTVISKNFNQISAVICKTDYSLGTGTVQHDAASDKLTVDTYAPRGFMANFTGNMLGNAIHASLDNTRGLLLEGVDGWHDSVDHRIEMPIYSILLKMLPGEQTLEKLLFPEVLRAAVVRSWNGIATHFLYENAVQQTSQQTTATITYLESRLHIGVVSLWVMIAGMLLLATFSMLLAIRPKHASTPREPFSVYRATQILTRSPDMQQLLQHSGHLNSDSISALVRNLDFRTLPSGELSLDQKDREIFSPEEGPIPKKKKLWIPLIARSYMVLVVGVLPLLLIIALELLYQSSQRREGLIDVTGSELSATYLARYLSALCVLLLATAFSTLDFTIAVFAPYALMRSNAVRIRRGLDFQLLGQLPLVALWKSLGQHHLSSALSNLAGLLGSTLTIIVSGLWLVDQSVVHSKPVTGDLSDAWNVTWYNSSTVGDEGAAMKLNQVQWREAAMPSTIWNDYVLPNIANLSVHAAATSSMTKLNHTLRLPALRAVLECTVVPDQYVAVTYYDPTGEQNLTMITATPPLEPKCQHAGANGVGQYYNYSTVLNANRPGSVSWIGMFADLHLGPWSVGRGSASPHENGELPVNLAAQRDNPPGCPSLGLILARVVLGFETSDNITALLCSQKVEQADLMVTYRGEPEHPQIYEAISPVLVEDSSHYLHSDDRGSEKFPYRVEKYIGTGPGGLTPFTKQSNNRTFDTFIDHLINGPNGVPAEQLIGKAHQQAFIEAAQRLYSKYMSLVIDLKFRTPYTPELSSKQQVIGTVIITTSRLQIDYASKLALQIMLAIMAALGMIAFWLSDLRDTLPRMPTTIASVMALLAGSQLCDDSHAILADLDEKTGNGGEKNQVCSLGWWSDSRASSDQESLDGAVSKPVKRFGIDIGRADELGFRESRWGLLRRRQNRSQRIIK